jgi:hypothetical protein
MTSQIILAGQIAGAILAIVTLAGVGIKWGILKPIKMYIDKATYQIQPGANGGSSLPDAIKAIAKIDAKLVKMDNRVKKLENKICAK